MANILILDRDTVQSAVLADRLESLGHRVYCVLEFRRLFELSALRTADLLFLDIDSQELEPAELVAALRGRPKFQATALLAHSARLTPARRLEALRAGVEDILPSNYEIEELVLRVQRLLGSRTGQMPVLQGSLANHQLIEFLQYVRDSRRSGTLRVQARQGSGFTVLRQGEIASATWDSLEGESALLAMLGLMTGSFRLETDPQTLDGGESPILDLQSVLLRAAWFEDQLTRWRPSLPPASTGLEVNPEKVLPDFGEGLLDLPIAAVIDKVRQPGGARLFDLRSAGLGAPQEVDLAVAMLINAEVLAIQQRLAEDMSTIELQNSDRLRWSVEALLDRAQEQFMSVETYALLILFEPSRQPALEALLGGHANPRIKPLSTQLQRRRGGSVVLPAESGQLAIHVQQLSAESLARLMPILPTCHGILTWLAEESDENLLGSLATKLESLGTWVDVLMLTLDPVAEAMGERLAQRHESWRISNHPPRTLGGLLRYFPGPES